MCGLLVVGHVERFFFCTDIRIAYECICTWIGNLDYIGQSGLVVTGKYEGEFIAWVVAFVVDSIGC